MSEMVKDLTSLSDADPTKAASDKLEIGRDEAILTIIAGKDGGALFQIGSPGEHGFTKIPMPPETAEWAANRLLTVIKK